MPPLLLERPTQAVGLLLEALQPRCVRVVPQPPLAQLALQGSNVCLELLGKHSAGYFGFPVPSSTVYAANVNLQMDSPASATGLHIQGGLRVTATTRCGCE